MHPLGRKVAHMKEILPISSRSNATVLRVASLKEKKYRDKYSSFLVEGWKLVEEALLSHLPVYEIFISEKKSELYLDAVLQALQKSEMEECSIFVLSEACFEKISTEKSPQGIIAVIKHLDFFQECIKINKKSIFDSSKILCLYSVRDPGNLGAIVRSAAAFGTDTLILSNDCADVYNPKTLRAAMGSLFKLRIFIAENMAACVSELRALGRRVFAAELTEHAQALDQIDLGATDVFVIGNEGHGISEEISSLCTQSVYIPIARGVESLNASVAASVLLWELGKK